MPRDALEGMSEQEIVKMINGYLDREYYSRIPREKAQEEFDAIIHGSKSSAVPPQESSAVPPRESSAVPLRESSAVPLRGRILDRPLFGPPRFAPPAPESEPEPGFHVTQIVEDDGLKTGDAVLARDKFTKPPYSPIENAQEEMRSSSSNEAASLTESTPDNTKRSPRAPAMSTEAGNSSVTQFEMKSYAHTLKESIPPSVARNTSSALPEVVDDGANPDNFGMTDPNEAFNTMASKFETWAKQQRPGIDVFDFSNVAALPKVHQDIASLRDPNIQAAQLSMVSKDTELDSQKTEVDAQEKQAQQKVRDSIRYLLVDDDDYEPPAPGEAPSEMGREQLDEQALHPMEANKKTGSSKRAEMIAKAREAQKDTVGSKLSRNEKRAAALKAKNKGKKPMAAVKVSMPEPQPESKPEPEPEPAAVEKETEAHVVMVNRVGEFDHTEIFDLADEDQTRKLIELLTRPREQESEARAEQDGGNLEELRHDQLDEGAGNENSTAKENPQAPVKSMSKKARNKAKKEAKAQGGK